MSGEEELFTLIDLVYAAVLDGDLWPRVLGKLAEATGAMQSIIATMDGRTKRFDSISRRTIAELDASYKNYWAYRNPLWAKSGTLPAGAVYSLDELMPRQEFAKTPIYNEWWKAADYSLAMLGTNVRFDAQTSSVICVINAPRNDTLTRDQTRLFKVATRHIGRALEIRRRFWTLEHMPISSLENLESLRDGAVLVDAEANVLHTNSVAEAMLEAGEGVILEGRGLATIEGATALQRLIASCARAVGPLRGPLGGNLEVRRGPQRSALRLTVTPLRSQNPAAEIPWLGLRAPVALVTVTDPEMRQRQLAHDLHARFGLTTAEAGLATEIVKGDGREAAARRRGISVATARAQLSSIFEKTGTHRQAELVHLLLEFTGNSSPDNSGI